MVLRSTTFLSIPALDGMTLAEDVQQMREVNLGTTRMRIPRHLETHLALNPG
jgi:hypothetical protein